MKLLFLSYHFLGPLSPLAVWLADGSHEILFASSRSAPLQKPFFDGIKRVILKRFSPPVKKGSPLDAIENALRAARNAENSFLAVKESGFSPDIVFTASSGGAALSIPAVFPNAYWINFLEAPRGAGLQEKDLLVQRLQMGMAQKSLVFYQSQKALFPEKLRAALGIFTPVVNTDFFCPATAGRDGRLAVFLNSRNPHSLLQEFLGQSPKNRAVWIASNMAAKKAISEIGFDLPRDRLEVVAGNDREELRQVFRRAQMAFFEAPCEMALQAMACGCATFACASISGEDLPPDMRQLRASGREISLLLDNPERLLAYGAQCRAIVNKHRAAKNICPAWFAGICQDMGAWKQSRF